jgi:hypothetical protein
VKVEALGEGAGFLSCSIPSKVARGCMRGCIYHLANKKGLGNLPNPLISLERETGFESVMRNP